jgi:hypothetical protein
VALRREKPVKIGVKAPLPGFVAPARATAVDTVPKGTPIEFDGYGWVSLRATHPVCYVRLRSGMMPGAATKVHVRDRQELAVRRATPVRSSRIGARSPQGNADSRIETGVGRLLAPY